MRVRLLVSRAGVDFAQAAGDVIDCDAREAAQLVAAGQAESLDAPHAAVSAEYAAAVVPKARGRRG